MNTAQDKTRTSKKRLRTGDYLETLKHLYELQKLQPQAVDLEEAVLGALMVDKESLGAVIDILHPECFYTDAHQRIYSAIQKLFTDSVPVDILTVAEQLKKSGELDIVGGRHYIVELSRRVASSAHAEYHSRIILQKYIQREIIRMSTESIRDAYEDTTDVFTLLDQVEENLYTIISKNIRKNYDSMAVLIKQSFDQIQEASKVKTGMTGVFSGFSELDRTTGGWQKSDLIIIAARPGIGKSSLALAFARNAAVDHQTPAAIFTLEMSSIQLVNRLISYESEIPADKIRKGQLDDNELTHLNNKIKYIADAPIFIDDTPAMSIFEFSAKARRLQAKHNVQLIVVDYLQLMVGDPEGRNKGNREVEIATISRSLKSIAKQLNIPIIAISQLSRAVEKRGSGTQRPILSDLRESGAIEQDADLVLFIYRADMAGLNEYEDGTPAQGIAELVIAKHRNGPLRNIKIRWVDRFAKFADMDYSDSASFTPSEVRDFTEPRQKTFIKQSENWDKVDDSDEFQIEEDEGDEKTPF